MMRSTGDFMRGSPVGGVAEGRRQEERAHQGFDLVATLAESDRQARHFGGIGLQRHELAPQLLDDHLGRARLGQQDRQDLVAAEAAGLAEEGLLAIVVPVRMLDELSGLAVDAPAGEGTRRRLDVGFAVLALAQGEELEQFASEVLVGLARHRSLPSR